MGDMWGGGEASRAEKEEGKSSSAAAQCQVLATFWESSMMGDGHVKDCPDSEGRMKSGWIIV